MKIRNGLLMLLVAVALIPIFSLLANFVWSYFFSQHTLFAKMEEMNFVKKMNISEVDKKMLLGIILNRPKNIQDALIFENGQILFSNIPDFEGLEKIDVEKFMRTVTNPNDGALFQIVTLPAESVTAPVFHIVKFKDSDYQKHRQKVNVLQVKRRTIIFCFAVAEAICIFFALFLSNRISKSIVFIEENVERLADGKFENVIYAPKSYFFSNEITALSKNLETLRQALKENKIRRDRFIMGVSHDLRSPLAVIKGYGEAILDGVLNKVQTKKSVEIILQKTCRLEEMISQLINFVKLDSSEWQNNFIETDLREFLLKEAKLAKATGEIFERRVETCTEIPKGTIVKMDRLLFERALENILSNAIRYSKKGCNIFTKSRITNGNAEISIRDTGQGISKEDLPQIFNMFYKANNARTEEGLGIGLVVVKTIIEAHGWKIRAESEKGNGAIFIITIPLENSGGGERKHRHWKLVRATSYK